MGGGGVFACKGKNDDSNEIIKQTYIITKARGKSIYINGKAQNATN